MTDIDAGAYDMTPELSRPSTFEVEDTYWGYKIRSGLPKAFGVVVVQVVSFFFGVCFAVAALGILLLPTLFFDGDFSAMRIGSATLFGAMAAYLLWFASRGQQVEVHVDNSFSELREVICNRAGKPTTVGSYPFDSISGVFVEPIDDRGMAQLFVQYRVTSQTVLIAQATEAQLTPLRNLLARDILTKA